MQVTQEYYMYTLNPVESNHRDGPTGHKNLSQLPALIYIYIYIYIYTCTCIYTLAQIQPLHCIIICLALKCSAIIYLKDIRDYGSTLYVGMALKKWPPTHFNCELISLVIYTDKFIYILT